MPPARLSPGTRRTLQVVGPLLLLAGLTLFVLAVTTSFGGSGHVEPSPEGFDAMAGDIERSALFGFSGVLLLGVGAFVTKLGYLRVASDVLATETEGAVAHVAGSVRKGWEGAPQAPVVRVRCRACRTLAPEDAAYCGKCGKAL